MTRWIATLLALATAGAILAALGPIGHPILFFSLMVRDAPAALRIPVAGVAPRQLVDAWGAPRDDGRSHEGIDIFALKGTAVTATTEGIVTRVGRNRLGGNVVWILGPGRQMHYYAHLERFNVAPGDAVEPGAIVGYIGNTGNARTTPPHLHYGLYAPGGATNPYPLLRSGNPR